MTALPAYELFAVRYATRDARRPAREDLRGIAVRLDAAPATSPPPSPSA